MRKLILAIFATLAFLTAGTLSHRAEALPVGNAAIDAAVHDLGLAETVHCRPGRWHHRFRPHDGCFRRVYRYGPPVFYPRRVYRPIYRPYRVYRRGWRRW
jgi:hypothetical protein